MDNTFVKTLKFLSITGMLDAENNAIKEPVEKQASFYKLSQTEPRQAKLFFMMRPLYREVKMIGAEDLVFIADPSTLHDLTMYAIECLLIVDDKFTNIDKTEFMNDTFAVMAFGEWFLQDSTPFFLEYMMNYFLPQSNLSKQGTIS